MSVARKLHGGSGGGGSGHKHGAPAAELFAKIVHAIRSNNGLMVSGVVYLSI